MKMMKRRSSEERSSTETIKESFRPTKKPMERSNMRSTTLPTGQTNKSKVIHFSNLAYDDLDNVEDDRIASAAPDFLNSISYPSSLDYRSQGIVTSVKSQGSCGSCWACTATAAY